LGIQKMDEKLFAGFNSMVVAGGSPSTGHTQKAFISLLFSDILIFGRYIRGDPETILDDVCDDKIEKWKPTSTGQDLCSSAIVMISCPPC
jgi:hypothetical protein